MVLTSAMGMHWSKNSGRAEVRKRIEALVEPMPEHEVAPVDFDRRMGVGPITARTIVGLVATIALAGAVVVSCGGEDDSAEQLWGNSEGMAPQNLQDGASGGDEVASGQGEGNRIEGEDTATPIETTMTDQTVVVSVQGMVRAPGLLSVEGNARVGEVIEKAGGPLGEASLLQINLAEVVVDGMQIVVDREGSRVELPGMPAGENSTASESAGDSPGRSAGGSAGGREGEADGGSAGGLVNLNSADATTLQTLDGVGPATAEAIIAWRESNGEFSTVEQLMEVRGIGPAKFEAMKDDVTV